MKKQVFSMREILNYLGFDYRQRIKQTKKRNAQNILKCKEERSDESSLNNYNLESHFAHETLAEESDQIVLKSSLIDRISFLKRCFSPQELAEDSFLDLGDPSGIFFTITQ